MRKNPWAKDPQYIVELTRQLVTPRVLSKLQADGWGVNGRMLFDKLTYVISPKISPMTGEKLGQICEYGSKDGFDLAIEAKSGLFLNRTGLCDILTDDQMDVRRFHTLREAQEFWAVAVTVCFARDILLQERYVNDQEVLEEEILDQARVDGQVDFWEKQRTGCH